MLSRASSGQIANEKSSSVAMAEARRRADFVAGKIRFRRPTVALDRTRNPEEALPIDV